MVEFDALRNLEVPDFSPFETPPPGMSLDSNPGFGGRMTSEFRVVPQEADMESAEGTESDPVSSGHISPRLHEHNDEVKIGRLLSLL